MRSISFVLCFGLVGCGYLGVRDSPKTSLVDLDDPACDGTHEGRACLTLVFDLHTYVRRDAEGDLQGRFEWGLYKGGDVGLTGPGDHEKVYGTPEPPPSPESLPWVDLSAPEAEYVVTLPNVPARDYQVIAYLDDDGSGEPDDGDPATFPSDPFEVDANEHVLVNAELDVLLF